MIQVNVLARAVADHAPLSYSNVAVLFADIQGFTPLSQTIPQAELVRLLDLIFTCFDELVARKNLYKMDTVGDAFIVVGGLSSSMEGDLNHHHHHQQHQQQQAQSAESDNIGSTVRSFYKALQTFDDFSGKCPTKHHEKVPKIVHQN